MSELEDAVAFQVRVTGLPPPEREYKFHDGRRWRFDFAWPALKVAAEVEGGTWVEGRHSRGKGFDADCEKYNTAALDGWTVLRLTAQHVSDGRALTWITELLEKR